MCAASGRCASTTRLRSRRYSGCAWESSAIRLKYCSSVVERERIIVTPLGEEVRIVDRFLPPGSGATRSPYSQAATSMRPSTTARTTSLSRRLCCWRSRVARRTPPAGQGRDGPASTPLGLLYQHPAVERPWQLGGKRLAAPTLPPTSVSARSATVSARRCSRRTGITPSRGRSFCPALLQRVGKSEISGERNGRGKEYGEEDRSDSAVE